MGQLRPFWRDTACTTFCFLCVSFFFVSKMVQFFGGFQGELSLCAGRVVITSSSLRNGGLLVFANALFAGVGGSQLAVLLFHMFSCDTENLSSDPRLIKMKWEFTSWLKGIWFTVWKSCSHAEHLVNGWRVDQQCRLSFPSCGFVKRLQTPSHLCVEK